MKLLAGDLLTLLLQEPLPPRERSGGTDPQSVLEFLAYDIPFRTEPAVGVVFRPQEPRRG
jgi:hypothetical protein